jgi:ribonuclease VapC
MTVYAACGGKDENMKKSDPEGPADAAATPKPPRPNQAIDVVQSRATRGASAAIDASALLALLFAEPGAEEVADAIANIAAVSTVNLCETATVLIRRGLDAQTILSPVREQVIVEPFTDADALAAAKLYPQTAAKGLSLGDRACIALADRLGSPAVTAEHVWSELDLGIEVRLIRGPARR